MTAVPAALTAYPMHGEVKLRREGWRTRDAHLMEWFGRLLAAPLEVVSRPEPWPRLSLARWSGREPCPKGWRWLSRQVAPFSVQLADRRRWWISSAPSTPMPSRPGSPVVAWNPLGAAHVLSHMRNRGPWVFDLLDDWSRHHAFTGIKPEVERAYRRVLSQVDVVTANSEATVELARRFDRNDVFLIPNGCDPDRFSMHSQAAGPLTIGYGGKIGPRLDGTLIEQCVRALSDSRFVFAGPILDRATLAGIKGLANVDVLGDVPYSRYPQVLQQWDVAWVPHALGKGREVGGDVIKIYEYRAAGLPVFTTPIIGSERALAGVRVVPSESLTDALGSFLATSPVDGRVPREAALLPPEVTWQKKAERLLQLLGHV